MRIRFDATALRRSRWYGHLLRFALGGAITVVTGLVADGFGPGVGGVLLAYPAILPAAIILTVRTQDAQAGQGARGDRGRHAAILAAAGASTGSVGLLAFALVAWSRLPRAPAWLALPAATAAWATVAWGAWLARKRPRG